MARRKRRRSFLSGVETSYGRWITFGIVGYFGYLFFKNRAVAKQITDQAALRSGGDFTGGSSTF